MEYFKKLALKIYEYMEKMDSKPVHILYDNKVRENLTLLNPAADITEKQKEYVIEKFALCLMILVVGGLLSVILWIKDGKSSTYEDNIIYRNHYGEISKTVNIVAGTDKDKVSLNVVLEPREYTIEEQKEMYEPFIKSLEEKILGDNTSLMEIKYDLNLVDNLEGYPFSIDWKCDGEYIDTDGKLLVETLENPEATELIAEINGNGFTKVYSIICKVYSRAKPFTMEEVLKKELIKLEQESRNQDYMTLPSEYKNEKLIWTKGNKNRALIYLLLTPIAAVIVYGSKDRDLHKLIEERESEMLKDYPEIVSKLSLYIGAGMTVQNAWNRIAIDYKKKREKTGIKRYAFEEMLITMYEIESGVSIYTAYERFGKRCRSQCYMKMMTLVSQNIKKGSINLAVLLQQEAKEAFEERKHTARKLGEKAGTKLLIPMIMILAVVMVIIVVPAFINQM